MSKIIRTRKPSVLPYYAAALVFVVLCAVLPVYRLWALAAALAAAAAAFLAAKKVCPPRVVETEVPFHTGVEDVDAMLADIQQKLDTLHSLNESLPDPQLSAAMTRMEKAGRSIVAGLSLGEYGAILTAGAMSLEDVFRIVRQRGILMQEAVPTGGAMCAVLGMDGEKIAKICDETEGIVSVANYNCPGQIVITGEEGAVAVAAEKLKEAGARRCIPLNVSGPFHSAMLKEAGEKLGKVLEQVELRAFSTPYVTNVTAEYVTEPSEIKELLGRQVYSSVKWQQSVERMIADGVDTFIEIGPGRTLTGFLKKINKNVTGLHIEKVEDLDVVVKMLGEKQ